MILAALFFGLRMAVILVVGAILAFLLNSFVDAAVDIRAEKKPWKILPQTFAMNIAVDLVGLFFPAVNLIATKQTTPSASFTSRAEVLRRNKISKAARLAHAELIRSMGADAERDVKREIEAEVGAPSND